MKKVIVGKLNSTNEVRYWNAGNGYTPDVICGDYAIVENKNDYDLVKIIGIMDINEKYEHFLVPNKISKTAVRYLARCQVRKD